MDMVEPGFDHRTFTRNRGRLLAHDVAAQFFDRIVAQARRAKLMSSEDFPGDGTLIDAWASLESFKKKASKGCDVPPSAPTRRIRTSIRTEKPSNDTRVDDRYRIARREERLRKGGNAVLLGPPTDGESQGLLCEIRIAEANGFAMRELARQRTADRIKGLEHVTCGADKGYKG